MTDVQVGQSLSDTAMYRSLPYNAWISPIKFEEKESWGLADSVIVKSIVRMTSVRERSEISYRELIDRVHHELHTEKEYLHEAMKRILRNPPASYDGTVKRFEFRSP